MPKFTQIPETTLISGPVAGLRGSGNWAPDERPTDFRNFILFRNPNGTAPMTALMGKMGKEACTDPEFHWWDEPNDIVRFVVDGDVAEAGTTITVLGLDPTRANPDRVYGDPRHLKPGDLLMVERATEIADITDHEIVQVVSSTATTIVVVRERAGTDAVAGAASIPDTSGLTLIGSAYGEGSAAAAARSRNPIKFTNYCQIFKTSYEITNTNLKIKTRTGEVLSNDKKRKTFDHSRDMEMAFMFGQAFETTDGDGMPLRYMGGLREFIAPQNTTIFGAGVDLDTYLDALTPVFDFDTPAGDERIAFCGNGYLNNLNHLARLNGEVQFGAVIKLWGMNLREFILPQGRIFLKTHPLMNRHPRYRNSAFIIDGSAIKYRYLRDTKSEDNIQLPGTDKKMGQWLSECSLEVRYAGLTLGYHGNLTSVAA